MNNLYPAFGDEGPHLLHGIVQRATNNHLCEYRKSTGIVFDSLQKNTWASAVESNLWGLGTWSFYQIGAITHKV